MYDISRLLVILDKDKDDAQLIKSVGNFCKRAPVLQVYFLHVAKSLEIPDDLKEKYPNLLAPVDESIRKEIETEVEKSFIDSPDVAIEVLVEEGNEVKTILKKIKIKEIDLTIINLDKENKKSTHLVEKVVQLAKCSVVVVPKDRVIHDREINKMLVPIDFSETSKMAVQMALAFQKGLDNAEIIFQHVYSVPAGYHTSGKSYEEFAKVMEENAKKMHKKFTANIEMGEVKSKCIYTLDENEEPSDKIHLAALEEKVNAIAIGSKGRSGAASFLLGSTTERLLRYHADLPIFVVKDKKEQFDIFDALKAI
ncbi:universal stress protein [Flammeovirgaceae bacterium SG7u.111]|nr:universal stress protein [Flammeovirgaceae bacterium SG7u.132]WPO33996.1 universal stress protein [Flammeovirgaceae bacterium SG7u.111]